MAVTDDELTLTTTNRDHGVNGLDTCLQWLVNTLTVHNTRSLKLEDACALRLDIAEAIDWAAQRVDHATHETIAHGNGENLTGAVDLHALFNAGKLTEDYDTDFALVQV